MGRAMGYAELLEAVIERGIEAARRDYAHSRAHLEGALAGFERCRGKTPGELGEALREAAVATRAALHRAWTDLSGMSAVRRAQAHQAEVEWVCNCVSVVLRQAGQRSLAPGLPTARAGILVASVLAMAGADRVEGVP